MSRIINNIRRFFYKLFYSIPFAMKGGDEEILKSVNSKLENGITLNQKINDRNVFNDLLQEKETQEVKNFRYQTYLIDRVASKYKYIFGGKCKKIKPLRNLDNSLHFKQRNDGIVSSILDEFRRIDTYSTQKFLFDIKFEDFSRFNLSRYILSVDFDYDGKEALASFHFSKYYEVGNARHRIFLKELSKGINENNDALHKIKECSFVTRKAEGIDDMIHFVLYDMIPISFIDDKKNEEYIVTYKCKSFISEDIVKKHFSKEQDEKYRKKARKNSTFFADFTKKN